MPYRQCTGCWSKGNVTAGQNPFAIPIALGWYYHITHPEQAKTVSGYQGPYLGIWEVTSIQMGFQLPYLGQGEGQFLGLPISFHSLDCFH